MNNMDNENMVYERVRAYIVRFVDVMILHFNRAIADAKVYFRPGKVSKRLIIAIIIIIDTNSNQNCTLKLTNQIYA